MLKKNVPMLKLIEIISNTVFVTFIKSTRTPIDCIFEFKDKMAFRAITITFLLKLLDINKSLFFMYY